MPTTLITPEVQALLGTQSPPETNLFAISHEMVYDLADAVEFPTPLFLDPDYARKSRFGGLLCPPLATWKEWRQPINYFGAGQEGILEIPGPLHSYGLNGGSEWTVLRPAFVGDLLTRRYRVLDIYEKRGRSGLLLFVIREETQTNQLGEVVCRARRVNIHRELKAGGQESQAPQRQVSLPPVSPPRRHETVAKPRWEPAPQRYFEDVVVGAALPPVFKGPITTTHLVRWAAANGNYARIHWDLPFALASQQMPNVVVNGSLKNQYLAELLMRFAGEEGWFRRLYVQHRGMDVPGDLLTASGKVTDRQEKDGYGFVECEVGLHNSRGEQTATGNGTVVLPKRGQKLPLAWEE